MPVQCTVMHQNPYIMMLPNQLLRRRCIMNLCIRFHVSHHLLFIISKSNKLVSFLSLFPSTWYLGANLLLFSQLTLIPWILVQQTDMHTVVLKRESKWLNLWSKWPISDLVFHNIKMPPCSCPLGSSLLLTGALKWVAVQTSTSTYTGIMKGQT